MAGSKEVASSDRLCKWFRHDAEKWKGFRKQYLAELRVKAKSWQPILEPVDPMSPCFPAPETPITTTLRR